MTSCLHICLMESRLVGAMPLYINTPPLIIGLSLYNLLLVYSPQLTDEENKIIFGKCNNANGHGHNYKSKDYIKAILYNSLVICMYGPPPPHPTLGTFHFAALENTGMSSTLEQILVGNSPTLGQILAGISPTAGKSNGPPLNK